MRLIYFSSKRYPASTADALFVMESARGMARQLRGDFLFVVDRFGGGELPSDVPRFEFRQPWRRFRTIWYALAFPRLRGWLGTDAVVYTNEQPLALVALAWKPFFGHRVFYEAHGFFNWRRDRVFLRLWRWFIDGIVATSTTLRDLLVKLEPGLGGRVSVVRGGFDPEALPPVDARAATRSELGIGPDDFVVAYAGHFKTCGEKGITPLLDAVRSNTNTKALLIGGRPEEIEEYQRLHPDARAIFLGWMADRGAVMRYLQAADALVVPTARDTLYTRYSFPMKVYDYLALGKPTIVSDIPIIREVMTDDVAIASTRGAVADLSRAIQRLATDPDLAERLGAAAQGVAQKYTWERRAADILSAIR